MTSWANLSQLAVVSWLWLIGIAPVAVAQPDGELENMQLRAAAIDIRILDQVDDPIVISQRPVLRYSAPLIAVKDASLWCFTRRELPVAMLKVESRPTRWTCGVTSLSSELIEVRWDDSRMFRASKAGLTFEEVPKAPYPAETRTHRQFQMKEITRRFSATFTFADESEAMRLLPRALYRYSQPAAGIVDGAVFAFISTGTNPNAFVAIEARRGKDGKLAWYYGLARLTIAAVSVRLDDVEVWKVDRARRRVVRSGQPVLDGTYATSPYLKESS